MTEIPLKPQNYQKYPRNLKKDQICSKIIVNYQNTSEILKMTKIPPKAKKCLKYPPELKK